jgi:SNF2 family DNA or RNA helicase
MKTYGKARLKADGFWHLSLEPHAAMQLKRVLGRIAKDSVGVVKIKNTDEVCRELHWFCMRYPLDVKPVTVLERRAERHKKTAELFGALVAGSAQPQQFELAVPAREYQRVAAECMLRMGSLLLADSMGLGKSASAIAALTDPRTRPALVVTMTSLPGQWQDEIAKFCPQLRTHILKAGGPYDVRDKSGAFPDVLITSYSKLTQWADALAGRVSSVTFDEAQELRRKGEKKKPSYKYKAAQLIASKCAFRWGLSGTPIFGYGEEFLNVISILKPGALGARDEFVREWCKRDEEGKAIIKSPKAFGAYLRDAGLMLRRTREDVKRELPPLQRVIVPVEADEDALLSADSAAMRFAQMIVGTSGKPSDRRNAFSQFDFRLRQATGIAKAAPVCALVDMLVESGERVVLFGWHKLVYAVYREKLAKHNAAFYTGDESTPQRAESKKAFLRGTARVLVISLRTAAGLDGLQHASRTVVFGELDWAFGAMLQCEDRLNRDGQLDPVTAYYPLSDSGSDPIVSEVLGIKRGQLEGALDPNADDMIRQANTGDGIRRLAEQYLKRKGVSAAAQAQAAE